MTDAGQTPLGPKPPRRRKRVGATRKTLCATSARAFKRKKVATEIVDLRLSGLTVRQIAEKVKLSKSEVDRHLQRELEAMQVDEGKKKVHRTLQLARLDTWLHAIFKRAAKGDEKAITTGLKIDERRARVLGTDSPEEKRLKLTVLGEINWIFDIIEKELGKDAAQRVIRRIGEESGPAADDGRGGPDA